MKEHKIFAIEEVNRLKNGDVVYLTKWRNLKSGEKSVTTTENCLVAGHNEKWISFLNLTKYYKDCKIEEYGETWSLEPPHNSYNN